MSFSGLSEQQIRNVVDTLEAKSFPDISFMCELEGLIPTDGGAQLVRSAIPPAYQHHLLKPLVMDNEWEAVRSELVANHNYADCSPKDGSMAILRRNQQSTVASVKAEPG